MRLAIQCPYQQRALDEVTSLGLSWIQLRVGPGFPISTEDPGLDAARRAAEDLARRGIRVAALGCYRNLLSANLPEQRKERARLGLVLRMARRFGSDLVGVFAGRDPQRSVADNLRLFTRVWGPLAAEAEELGVRLAFENCTMLRGDPPRSINLATTPYIFEQMFARLPSPALGLELDPSHLAKQWIDPCAVVRRFAGRIVHVHAKDHETLAMPLAEHGRFDPRTSRDRLPGRGEIDFPAFLGALKEANYAGTVTLEPEHGCDLPPGISPSARQAALTAAIAHLHDARAASSSP